MQAWKDFQIDCLGSTFAWLNSLKSLATSGDVPHIKFLFLTSRCFSSYTITHDFCSNLGCDSELWKCKCKAVVRNWWVTTWKKRRTAGGKSAECQRFRLLACSHPQIRENKYYKIIYKIVSFLSQLSIICHYEKLWIFYYAVCDNINNYQGLFFLYNEPFL